MMKRNYGLWSAAEDALLIAAMDQGLNLSEIAGTALPGRTRASCSNRYARLTGVQWSQAAYKERVPKPDAPKIVVLTESDHLLRAMLLARQHGPMTVEVYAAHATRLGIVT